MDKLVASGSMCNWHCQRSQVADDRLKKKHFERIHIVEEQDLEIADLKMDIHTHILPQPLTGLR
jgi:hypothetical protein